MLLRCHMGPRGQQTLSMKGRGAGQTAPASWLEGWGCYKGPSRLGVAATGRGEKAFSGSLGAGKGAQSPLRPDQGPWCVQSRNSASPAAPGQRG